MRKLCDLLDRSAPVLFPQSLSCLLALLGPWSSLTVQFAYLKFHTTFVTIATTTTKKNLTKWKNLLNQLPDLCLAVVQSNT